MFVPEKLESRQPATIIEHAVRQNSQQCGFTGIHIAHYRHTDLERRVCLIIHLLVRVTFLEFCAHIQGGQGLKQENHAGLQDIFFWKAQINPLPFPGSSFTALNLINHLHEI